MRYGVGEPSRFARFWVCKAGMLRLLCAQISALGPTPLSLEPQRVEERFLMLHPGDFRACGQLVNNTANRVGWMAKHRKTRGKRLRPGSTDGMPVGGM